MNKEMVWGSVRHFLTLVSGAILAGNTTSLQTAIPDLMQKIASGDIATIISSAVIVFALLWSLWVKASEEVKTNIVVAIKTLGRRDNVVTVMAGKPTIAILGNLSNCSYCKTFWNLIGNSNPADSSKLAALIPNATIVNADAKITPSVYATWKTKAKFTGNYPGICVFDSTGKYIGKITGRPSEISPWTVEEITKRIKALCPECCTGDCETENPNDTNIPPTCTNCGMVIGYCQKCGQKIGK
jgi:hypothetical protein